MYRLATPISPDINLGTTLWFSTAKECQEPCCHADVSVEQVFLSGLYTGATIDYQSSAIKQTRRCDPGKVTSPWNDSLM